MRTRTSILLIAVAVFAAMLFICSGDYVFAGKDYNSSISNGITSIYKVNEEVGNILMRYGVGGAEINQVTDALARPEGIDAVDLKAMLVRFGLSDAGIEELLAKLDELGIGSDTAQSAPAATGIIEIKDGS